MLVLSRKLGEQVVLPGLDVTVTILGVSGKKVKLGIAAPPEVSIQRQEIRDQVCQWKTPRRHPNETAAVGAVSSAALPQALDAMLAHSINQRTAGQIGALQVDTTEGRVIIHGRARSYHARQLAQAAVIAALKASSSCRLENVEFNIEMVNSCGPMKGTG